jgi:predicted protein tyrosine phosphatase
VGNRHISRRDTQASLYNRHQLTRVEEMLFLGSLKDADALATSNPHGIRSVITLCQEPVRYRRADVQYLQFPIDEVKTVDSKFLGNVLAAIESAIERGPTLCHCLLGVSRSPAVLAAYLRGTRFSSYDAALRFLEGLRPCVDPGPTLLRGVKIALENLASGPPGRLKPAKSLPKRGDR